MKAAMREDDKDTMESPSAVVGQISKSIRAVTQSDSM